MVASTLKNLIPLLPLVLLVTPTYAHSIPEPTNPLALPVPARTGAPSPPAPTAALLLHRRQDSDDDNPDDTPGGLPEGDASFDEAAFDALGAEGQALECAFRSSSAERQANFESQGASRQNEFASAAESMRDSFDEASGRGGDPIVIFENGQTLTAADDAAVPTSSAPAFVPYGSVERQERCESLENAASEGAGGLWNALGAVGVMALVAVIAG